ncbi:MAG: sugar phosphate isomerase/epimerase [Gorillibacterium sp.]|nr:sugar phosphate isomerase/epimerase [Gorillibacterium sp.]
MTKIPVGLQLYTLRDETAKDFPGTLKKVAELGFQVVEFAGYGGIPATEMKQLLDELGLKAISSHVGYDLLLGDLEGQIAYAKEIGIEYLVLPWFEQEKLQEESEYKVAVASFRTIAEKVTEAGLTFLYHNHAFEFAKLGGEFILDRLYREIDESVLKAELDLYWVKKAGLDPKEYLLSYKGRVPIIHVKDMAGDEEGFFAEVGQGIIDYPAIFEVAPSAGVKYYLVEQDVCKRPALESIKMSIDYLKSIGIA